MLNPHRAVVFLAKRSREKVGEGSEAILTSAPPVEFQPRRRSSRETSEMAWGVLDPSSSGRALVCFPRASVECKLALSSSMCRCIMSDIDTGPMALMMMDSVQNPILNSLILFLIIGTDL
ncbi:hypothetical protein BRADI_5g09151v3 [Brachypodium distachyon]|uniref:Uncharacterized protein n=1 Tax=Brachypodium distachyon TaxID=15368 RepID=A0A0Q3E804_BRADI|nr:hypothetical protein BRADI_5g09151v3 [Brachypodium distachyon]